MALTASLAANAQSSSTAAPAAQTTATTLATTVPPAESPWSATAYYEGGATVGDFKENGGGALIDSTNFVGVNYKINDTYKAKLNYNFRHKFVSDESRLKHEPNFVALDPTIHLNISTKATLFGSKPIVWLNRYYIPVSDASQKSHTMGTFRTESQIDWDVNPKVTLSGYVGARYYINTSDNANGARGSDGVLRATVGPVATYNFSDNLNVYYMPYVDVRGHAYNRGNWGRTDEASEDAPNNTILQDFGVSYTMGKVTINPYYESQITRFSGDEGYSYIDSTVYLILTATM